MIGRLIDRFRAAGLDPSAEEVLDALWLASRFVAPPETAAPRGAEAPLRTAPIPDLHAGSGAEPAALPGPRRPAGESALADVQVRSAPQHRPHSTAQSDGAVVASAPARARRTPPAEAFDSPRLPTAPELSRALRPMRRQVDSRSRVVVDEGATAARLADALLVAARAASAGTANDALDMSRCQPLPVMPVLRPAKDRRPGLIIVSDTSRTMVLWRERVAGFARLLQSAGGMGAATWHEMDTEAPGGALALRRTGSRGGERSPIPAVRWVATQLSPDGIRAVIFLTDAVSEGFRRKDVEQWLSSVARRAPLAIVQVLPPWFWARTGLRAFEGVQVRTGSAGRSNTGLSVDPPPLARDPRERGAPVPILSTDAPDLAAWARIVTGMTGDRLHAVRVVAPARATEPGGRRATTTALAWATRSASKPPHTPDPDALLRSFRDGCSATALRIATLAAAAPLTLPLLVFLAQTMVPGARRHHLAEVLLGGLLREAVADVRSAREDELHYEFHEGVRERLLGRLTAGEAQEVLRRAGTCMESRLGLGFGFHTLLPFHRGARRRALDDRATSFTLVAERVLRRMGVDLSDWDERRLRVFLSFADDDADMAVELERHLTPQVRVGRVSVWHKGRVPLGEDRTVARDRHLREADLFLVLLSGHYMKSPETRAELQLLRAEFGNRNAQVLQIPVRPLGRGNPLSRLPTLETQPISTLLDRDSAWLRVALEVERTALHNARVHAPIRVFVSAAEEDEAFVSLLERHLALPNLSAEMEISHRGLVPAGDDKKAYIERRLGEAQMILVLVSADYLHEDALYRRELSAARAHCRRRSDSHTDPGPARRSGREPLRRSQVPARERYADLSLARRGERHGRRGRQHRGRH